MENKDKESRWSKFVSSFEDYTYNCVGDIDESYLTSHEKSIMFKEAANALKLKIKNIRERRRQNKTQTKKDG